MSDDRNWNKESLEAKDILNDIKSALDNYHKNPGKKTLDALDTALKKFNSFYEIEKEIECV